MYSVIDIESNGAGFREECIIELAIFIYDGHEVVDQLITLVNPEAEITQYVQKLTGITPKMVKRDSETSDRNDRKHHARGTQCRV